MAPTLRDSVVVAVVGTRPRGIPLPMITMRKSIHGFLFPYMLMGLRLVALPPELRYNIILKQKKILISGKQLFRRDWLKKGIVSIKVLID